MRAVGEPVTVDGKRVASRYVAMVPTPALIDVCTDGRLELQGGRLAKASATERSMCAKCGKLARPVDRHGRLVNISLVDKPLFANSPLYFRVGKFWCEEHLPPKAAPDAPTKSPPPRKPKNYEERRALGLALLQEDPARSKRSLYKELGGNYSATSKLIDHLRDMARRRQGAPKVRRYKAATKAQP